MFINSYFLSINCHFATKEKIIWVFLINLRRKVEQKITKQKIPKLKITKQEIPKLKIPKLKIAKLKIAKLKITLMM